MKCRQVIGGGRDFSLRGLQHLLVTLIDEFGNLTSDQISRVGENLHSAVGSTLYRRRGVVLLEKHAAVGARGFEHVETVVAEPTHCIFETLNFDFLCHSLCIQPAEAASRGGIKLPAFTS